MSDKVHTINPKYVFGHQRGPNHNDFISKISVKELLLQNPDVLAVAVMGYAPCDQEFHKGTGNEDIYINAIAHKLAIIDLTNGIHCGDCIKVASSCEICMLETYYVDGLSLISYFDDFLEKMETSTKDTIKQYDPIILLMTLLQMQEIYWTAFTNNLDAKYKDAARTPGTVCHPDDFSHLDKYLDIEKSLTMFLDFPVEKQQELYSRMEKVRQFAINPDKVEGIPWW